MKILILNWRDPKHPLAGGAEISLLNNARYWQRKGAEVTWFTSSFEKAKREEVFEGIKIVRKGNYYTVVPWFFYEWMRGKFKTSDIVLDCFHFVPFMTPLYVKTIPIIGLINEVAGDIWFDNLPLVFAFIGFKIEPFIIRLYKKVRFITVSRPTKRELEDLGISQKNISLIYNGFTPLKNNSNMKKEKKPTLIFLGRLSKDKGIEDALLMLELLIRDNKDLMLWIVGKFESKKYEKRVRKLIEQFKVKKNCVFYGFVNEEKKAELLARAWLLVHPSTKEGWGLNVIESNSVGTPAVGYNVGGLTDSIVDNRTGILVEPDAISLADGVEQLLEKKEELARLTKNAKDWSKKFNWEKTGSQTYELLKKNCRLV